MPKKKTGASHDRGKSNDRRAVRSPSQARAKEALLYESVNGATALHPTLLMQAQLDIGGASKITVSGLDTQTGVVTGQQSRGINAAHPLVVLPLAMTHLGIQLACRHRARRQGPSKHQLQEEHSQQLQSGQGARHAASADKP